MKLFAALMFSVVLCGAVSAAPMALDETSRAAEVVETGANSHGVGLMRETENDNLGGESGAVPEPGTMLLLGAGLGAAALARRKK